MRYSQNNKAYERMVVLPGLKIFIHQDALAFIEAAQSELTEAARALRRFIEERPGWALEARAELAKRGR